MPVQLGTRPLADFDRPIDLLMDCHRRIERFLWMLLQVADRDKGGLLSVQTRESLATALNYFREAAPRHTEDEERSLFPRMKESGDSQAISALSKIARLEADHKHADSAHQHLDELGRRWLAKGLLSTEETAEFVAIARNLVTLYRDHIHCEDHEVFPVARSVLTNASLLQIGAEMKQRRAANLGRSGSACAKRRARLQSE